MKEITKAIDIVINVIDTKLNNNEKNLNNPILYRITNNFL